MVSTEKAGVQLEVDGATLQSYTNAMADSYITDPDILSQLNAEDGEDAYVTDPNLLSQLDSSEEEESYVTDPNLLGQLEAPEALRLSSRDRTASLTSALQGANLYGSATSALGQAPDKSIRRREDGNWDLPFMTQASENPVMQAIGGLTGTVAQKTGARLDAAGPAVDQQAIQNIFHKFQQDNNLSDEEVTATWTDLGNMSRKWGRKEPVRVLSDGSILPNYQNSDWLDEDKAKAMIDAAPAPDSAKENLKANLRAVQNTIAQAKMEAYGAASAGVRAYAETANPIFGKPVGKAISIKSPDEWARENGRSKDFGTPKFVRDYEAAVVDKAGMVKGLAVDVVQSDMKVLSQLLGLAGVAGAESLGAKGAELSEASNLMGEGGKDTGLVGAVVEESFPIITQVALTRGMGAVAAGLGATERAAMLTGTVGALATAGGQSAGATYAAQIAEGDTPEEARAKAVKAGVNTAVITGIFQGLGAGGVEKVAAGRSVGEVTVRDLLKSASREELIRNTKSFAGSVLKSTGGEAAEEGLDELTSAFLTADPDTNLADAWDNAVKAAQIGGFIGGAVDVAAKSVELQAADELIDRAAAVAPESAAAAQETGEVLTKEQANPEESPALSLSDETETPEPPAGTIPAAPLAEIAEENLSEGVPEAGVQPPSGEPAVAESAEVIPPAPAETPTDSLPEGTVAPVEGNDGSAPLLGTPRPGFDNQFVTPEGATVELLPDGKASFIVPPDQRGQGAGNAAVERVKQHADATGTAITLDIEPLGNEETMNREQLADWYERRGFAVSEDRKSAIYEPSPAPVESRKFMWTSGSLGPNAKNQFQTPVTLSNPKVENDVTLEKAKFLPDGSVSGGNAASSHFAEIVVEKVDGKAIGVTEGSSAGKVGWHLMEDGSIHISSIKVPERLRRQGIASQLVEEVIKWRNANSPSSEIVFTTPSVEGSALQESFGTRLQPQTPNPNEQNPQGQPESQPAPEAAQAEATVEGGQETGEAGGAGDAVTETPLDPNPPLPEPPNFEAALTDDSVTGLYHAQTDADRARLGLPPRFKQPRTTDQAAWDRATAAEDAHRAAGKPGTAGTDLLTNLLNDIPRVLTKEEHALLLHEKLVREQEVEAAQGRLNSLTVETPDGVRKDAQAMVKKAQDAFDLLITYADAAGSKAGLSLQARKMLIHTDFTLATVVNRLKAAKNMNAEKPVEWTEKDQAAAIAIANKLQQAQERVQFLEDALSKQDEAASEQALLIEQLTKDVERAQTKLENRMRTSRARNAVRARLDPLVEEAKARMASRKRSIVPSEDLPQGDFAVFGPTPEMLEDLKDISIISAGWLVDKTLTLQEFSSRLVADFGDWVAEHAQNLFRQARSLYIETAESVTEGNAPTPESVVKDIDTESPLDKTDVWKLARAHVVAGKRGRNVLDAVFGDLSEIFPDITREEVSEAFTGYGKVVYPSDKEVPKELRRIRSLEREYSKQADIAAGQMPRRTGYQGDAKKGPEWAEVRAAQQKTADALRDLENQLREAGLPVPSDERKLANALNTKKRRLTNEIEEIELALATKTPRTPKTRTPIADDAETRTLEKRLAEKRAEYEQVFKDESAREKRLLGSLKKRMLELERRMREKDFSPAPQREPLNTAAKRKADYEFAKVRAKYDEMRHQYILDNAPPLKKAGHYVMSTGNLLKILTLGGDLGVVMRQLGTSYQALTRDLGMLAPTKEGAKKRADGSYLKKVLSEGVKSFGSREYEHEAYERLMSREFAGWDKISGLVLNAPFDVHRNTKEDIPPANLLDRLPWWLWPAIAGVKVSLFGASFPVSASIVALGAVTKPFLQALDRAQRTMTNQSRAMFADEVMRRIHDGHPTVQEAKAIAKAVMVGTGRGTATQMIESSIPFFNQVLLATRFYISRVQALTLYPLWNKDARAGGSLFSPSAAQKEIAKMYGRSVAGRAAMYGLAALVFGKALSGDDDEPEEGLVVDPRNPNFGRVKLATGVFMDFMSSENNFASAAVRYFGKVRVDPKTGRKKALGAGYANNVNVEALRFLQSKLNIQIGFLLNTHKGEYFGGKPVTFPNALEEITTAIIVNDTINVYDAMMEEYGPTVGAARASLFLGMMFGGAGTSVYDSEAEKEANRMARKEAELERRLWEAELND